MSYFQVKYTGHFFPLPAFFAMRQANIFNRTINGDNTGTCYPHGENGLRGCEVFVEGASCEMTGDEMAASVYPPFCSHLLLIGSSAYNHIFQSTGGDLWSCAFREWMHPHSQVCGFVRKYERKTATNRWELFECEFKCGFECESELVCCS